jgi:predicted ATPase
MGVHTGHAEARAGDYFGPALNRAARLMSVAHGGQIVVSGATEELSRELIPEDVTLVDLGQHRLRDLGRAERVFQVVHGDLVRDFPPLASVESYPSNLPQQVTTFVGRDAELDEVARALDDARVVTLTGVGGVGKTRLALQTAAELLPQFPHGAWLCELGPLSDASGVPDLIATALSIERRADETTTDSLVASLRDRELLLVLDNCEHLIVPAARLVDAIVRACPSVRVLATSREGLGVSGERLFMVRSLGVDDDDSNPAALLASDAVQLFTDRARDARGGFVATEENAPAIAQVCRRLDGIPLAIELAAARSRMMSPSEIARRIDERFRLLTGGSRTAVERHQTLQAAVDWSYALLDADEQALLDHLGVFAGGFTLDAAEAVALDQGSDLDVVDGLGQLVDKSLVVAEEGTDGSTRYRLLETIRQYALEHLDSVGVSDNLRRRHAEYYCAFVESALSDFDADEPRWARALDLEMANFRAALDWAIGIGDADVALRLAVQLGEFGAPRPRHTLARWIARVVDMPEAKGHPLRPHAAAWAAQGEATNASVAVLAQRVAEMDEVFADAGLELTSVAHLPHGSLALALGKDDECIRHNTLAAELALAEGNPRWAALCFGLLANILVVLDRLDEGISRAEQAIAIGREHGVRVAPAEVGRAIALCELDRADALEALERALAYVVDQGNEPMTVTAGTVLAEVLISKGDRRRALDLYTVLVERVSETRNHILGYLTCMSLGGSLLSEDAEASAVLLGGTAKFDRVARGHRKRRLEMASAESRRRLGDDEFERSTARGLAMTIEELLAFARATLSRLAPEHAVKN